MITATRFHDFSYGHRVYGHENKCKTLHGHNGRVHFTCQSMNFGSPLDSLGRVIDFGEIKKLCDWVEENWDHKFLLWEQDPMRHLLADKAWVMEMTHDPYPHARFELAASIVLLGANPTAENMARFLLYNVGPMIFKGTGIALIKVVMEETRKCSATAELDAIPVE